MTTTVTVGHDGHGVFIAIAVNGDDIQPPARPNPNDPADLFHDVIHAVLGVAQASGISPVLGTLAQGLDEHAPHDLRNLEEDAVLAIGRYLAYPTRSDQP